jgi:TonB family protein
MKKILLLALLFVSIFANAQEEDYEFLLMSSPELKQEYPQSNKTLSDGGVYHSFSFDGTYAFIYSEKHCGFYFVPIELRDGFQSMVPNLQKTNAKLFWERVKKTRADIDAFWNKTDSIVENEVLNTVSQQNPSKVFDVVEHMPSYPGGMGALMQYLSSNIKYPKEAEEKGAQGRVITSFIVEKDGSISDIKIKISVHPALDAEAIRIVKKMPKWIPGKQGGEPVRVKYTLPITFRLQ